MSSPKSLRVTLTTTPRAQAITDTLKPGILLGMFFRGAVNSSCRKARFTP
jgi:hypothetical protein